MCRWSFFQKIIRFAARLFGRSELSFLLCVAYKPLLIKQNECNVLWLFQFSAKNPSNFVLLPWKLDNLLFFSLHFSIFVFYSKWPKNEKISCHFHIFKIFVLPVNKRKTSYRKSRNLFSYLVTLTKKQKMKSTYIAIRTCRYSISKNMKVSFEIFHF